ncbi:FecR domain-containing protein [Anaerovorax odorimutans]|uniref:FecR domain-containing protein n=1 Tax=Anaerovorax odorimutans TaxID=109327 RepID=UPI0003F7C6F5|nr:FecR domain-containing protein [Anaerovorax odorimutans]
MKRLIRIVISILMIACFLIPNYSYGASSVRNATVTGLAGDVNIIKSGGEKVFHAKKGMKLTHGDRIITGKSSWIKLDVDGDKELKVGAKTYISLEELTYESGSEKTNVKLFKGKVWTNIEKKLNSGDTFQVKTPNAIMGARGTKFLVSYGEVVSDTGIKENKSKLTVIEGVVQAVSTVTVKVKDENFNMVDKQLTIAVSVEKGEDIELIKDKIQEEMQSIADEVQSMDENIELNFNDIKKVIESKISNKEMEAMKVKELKFEELDSFSIETIIEELNKSGQTEENKRQIDYLKKILENIKFDENKEEEKQENLINRENNETKIIYSGDKAGNGSKGNSSSSYAQPNIISPTSISLPEVQQEFVMNLGDSMQLTPTVFPIDAADKSLVWQTSNPDVLTVSNGYITAVGQGYATITVKTILEDVYTSCYVLVKNNNPSDFALKSAKTVDTYGNGIIDKIELTFSESIDKDSISINDISIIPDNGLSIGAIKKVMVDSDSDKVLDIYVEEESQGLKLNYNTGLTGKINISYAAIRSVNENYIDETSFTFADGASPVLLGWSMDFSGNDKDIRLMFSEELITCSSIFTNKILITDESFKSPISINNAVVSSRTEDDGSFTADIVLSSPDVPNSIIGLSPLDGEYYIQIENDSFSDTWNNNGILFLKNSLLKCSDYIADYTKPSIIEIVNSDLDNVIVNFNEFINADDLVYSKTGNVEFENYCGLLSGNKAIQFKLNNLTNGDTITISNILDLNGNIMKEETYEYNGSDWIKIEPFGLVSWDTLDSDGNAILNGDVSSVRLTFNEEISQTFNLDDIINDGKIYICGDDVPQVTYITSSGNNVILILGSSVDSSLIQSIEIQDGIFTSIDGELNPYISLQKPSIMYIETLNNPNIIRITFSQPMELDTLISDNIKYIGNSKIKSIKAVDYENTIFEIQLTAAATKKDDKIQFTKNITDINGNPLNYIYTIVLNSDMLWELDY